MRDVPELPPPIGAANDPAGPSIWAVGGGKGGVGKSLVATNLAVALSEAGYRVTLVDADLGGANLDTLLGSPRPQMTMGAFFRKEVKTLQECAIDTGLTGLSLVAGDADTLGAANPHHAQKLKLIRHLRKLTANVVVLDLGAGTTFNTLDLYVAADVGVAVTAPEPTALQNCFTFLKAATLRDLELRTKIKHREPIQGPLRGNVDPGEGVREALERTTRLVVNRARASEGRRTVEILSGLVSRFLGGSVQLAGVIRDDEAVRRSVQKMTPLVVSEPTSPAAIDLRQLAANLLGARDPAQNEAVGMGINETIVAGERQLHLQTEDLGSRQSAIRSQVFFPDGSVAYSRRTPYLDRFFVQLQVDGRDRARFHHAAVKRALQTGRIQVSQPKAQGQ